ncbi:HNH endonuclease [Myxococcus faecalis]|uniref:HNH endonuclease n=1 Tax=Myxococcus faecalis TaxID=3115646 RepID=UPI0038D1DAF9
MKRYLRPFRILRRWTTFNGAFQSALSVHEEFDENKVNRLLVALDQAPQEIFRCVYCQEPAKTWDHLFNTVTKGRFSGYGNRIFNLVPACRSCNEEKGAKHWRGFLKKKSAERPDLDIQKITNRLEAVEALDDGERYPWSRISERCPELAAKYEELISEVKSRLRELDSVSSEIRKLVREDIEGGHRAEPLTRHLP